MLETIAVVLLVLWVVGFWGTPMLWAGHHPHGSVHLVLLCAVIIVAIVVTRRLR